MSDESINFAGAQIKIFLKSGFFRQGLCIEDLEDKIVLKDRIKGTCCIFKDSIEVIERLDH